ncbi:MAG: hypothetical protein JW715_14365 [Sedimentisphaerales bacterium]|nr:hypothetical protein [Sedimentisphaerales bacterium]
MNTKKILFYLIAVSLAGCVPVMSLHCLYSGEDVIFDEKLLGTWVQEPNDPKTIWEFMRMDDPNNAYKLIFTDEEGRKGAFLTHLVKLQDKLFLDIFPSELPWEPEDPNHVDWPYNGFFMIPSHTFIKVGQIEPQLKLSLTIQDKMEELLKENPNAIEHTMIEGRLVLTATTKQLQAFILKYVDDERLFVEEVALVRKTASK